MTTSTPRGIVDGLMPRIRVTRRSFHLVSVTLAVIVVLELSIQPPSSETVTPFTVPSLPTVNQPTAFNPAQINLWTTTILTRPMFSLDRRPPVVEIPVIPDTASPSLPRVAGIIVTSSGRAAIFAAENGVKALVAGEGDQVNAFTIQTIQPGQITISGPGGERVLKPTFNPDVSGGVAASLPVPMLPDFLPQPLGPIKLPGSG